MGGFRLTTDSDSERWFRDLFHDIKNGRYPSPTNKRNRYCLSLCRQQRKILDFEWIDYNGGVIDEEEVGDLDNDIDRSDGLMIFLEARALLSSEESVYRFRRIHALIHSKLLNSNCPLFSVIIVITKYDEIPCNSFRSVVSPISGFVSCISESDRIYSNVIPVSCTGKGFFNVEVPLLDILDSGLIIDYLDAAVNCRTVQCESLKLDREALAYYINSHTQKK